MTAHPLLVRALGADAGRPCQSRNEVRSARLTLIQRIIMQFAVAVDLVADQLTDGRRFRILTIVDDCTRECLALVADTSLGGVRVARELDRLIANRGKPQMIVSDNGSEFTSNAILGWAGDTKVE
jgi:transposase InsO family protein